MVYGSHLVHRRPSAVDLDKERLKKDGSYVAACAAFGLGNQTCFIVADACTGFDQGVTEEPWRRKAVG